MKKYCIKFVFIFGLVGFITSSLSAQEVNNSKCNISKYEVNENDSIISEKALPISIYKQSNNHNDDFKTPVDSIEIMRQRKEFYVPISNKRGVNTNKSE